MNDISTLRNLGPRSAAVLRDAGVVTVADLRRIGAVDAFVLARDAWPAASWNLLWALAAGLEDRDWRSLTEAEKAALRASVDAALR